MCLSARSRCRAPPHRARLADYRRRCRVLSSPVKWFFSPLHRFTRPGEASTLPRDTVSIEKERWGPQPPFLLLKSRWEGSRSPTAGSSFVAHRHVFSSRPRGTSAYCAPRITPGRRPKMAANATAKPVAATVKPTRFASMAPLSAATATLMRTEGLSVNNPAMGDGIQDADRLRKLQELTDAALAHLEPDALLPTLLLRT